ncbi:CPBP family glutamic-type intramembrane protease [Pontibacter oryzae]|uniref:CPBP family intramembrane metalloprotease n=1 Tax=Pontibacter oryzae TaxID=2304593 RepID=A0A399RT05_9BACT|nr:CPBP family glutamic-type intramembrane protease [Pontibacter oryzae]RIJ33991.1 CPBP family intramembrane metalloprotease [Pontibacter oryzae]
MKTPYFFHEAPPFTPPPTILDTLHKICHFVLNPKLVKPEKNVLEVKLPLIFQLTFIELLLQTLLFSAIILGYTAFDLRGIESDLIKDYFANTPFVLIFTLMVLIGPIKEEVIFRLPLVYSKGFLLVALAVFMYNYGPVVSAAIGATHLQLIFSMAVAGVLATAFLFSRKAQACMYLLWKRHYTLVFYTITLLFALMHLLNYLNEPTSLLLLLVLIIPKFVGGVFLGYTRLRLGLAWAVAQHVFNNLVAMLLVYGFIYNN